jgi:hypothetical protein
VFVILAATAIGLGALILVRDAATSRRVVIEPFHAPPGLAARGIDGTIKHRNLEAGTGGCILSQESN